MLLKPALGFNGQSYMSLCAVQHGAMTACVASLLVFCFLRAPRHEFLEPLENLLKAQYDTHPAEMLYGQYETQASGGVKENR
jgi:hypothetical protein